MRLFARKDAAPLDAREQSLRSELARLETELHRLAHEAPKPVPLKPKPAEVRPAGAAVDFAPPLPRASAATTTADSGRYNGQGLRKFDLPALWQNMKNHLSGPTGNNPAMVKMLAVGSIHGLRPLRRERRVARNRFIFLFLVLLAVLWGVAYTYLRQR